MSRPLEDLGDPPSFPLRSDEALVVTGSLSTKPQDRTMVRADIVPVQVVTSDGITPVPFFRDEGEHGIGSALFAGRALFFSVGDDLAELDLDRGTVVRHDVPGLRDVHEMTFHDGDVLIANTGMDEVVVFSTEQAAITGRISLDRFRRVSVDEPPTAPPGSGGEPVEAVDRFHLNQVFADGNGDAWALVHHVNGKQLIRRVAEKVIKSHGNGGVINLSNGVCVPLQLHAPHTVRQVGDTYWILDSGRGEAGIYSRGWERQTGVPTVGWGRGADLGSDGAVLYAGMSPIRKRYLPFLPDRSVFRCCVEAFDTGTLTSLGSAILPNIEQINNVLLIDRSTAELLVAVPPQAHAAASARS